MVGRKRETSYRIERKMEINGKWMILLVHDRKVSSFFMEVVKIFVEYYYLAE